MQSINQMLSKDYQNGDYQIISDTEAHFPKRGVTIKGEYFDRVNGGEWHRTQNLITNEGIALILNVALGKTPKPAAYYIALFSGQAQPQNTWTAANFASAASEIVSTSEGYEGATRPEWTSANTNGNTINNMAAAAKLTIRTAGQLNVTGVALLTNSQKGGTSGTLVSATKYAAPRVFQDGDIYEIGYNISLTV